MSGSRERDACLSTEAIAKRLLNKPRKRGPSDVVCVRKFWNMYQHYAAQKAEPAVLVNELDKVVLILKNKKRKTEDEFGLLYVATSLLDKLYEKMLLIAWEKYQNQLRENPRVDNVRTESIRQIVEMIGKVERIHPDCQEIVDAIFMEHDRVHLAMAYFFRKKVQQLSPEASGDEGKVLISHAIRAYERVKNKNEKINAMIEQGVALYNYFDRKDEFDEIKKEIDTYEKELNETRMSGKATTDSLIAIAELYIAASAIYQEIAISQMESQFLMTAKAYLDEISEPNDKKNYLLAEIEESMSLIDEDQQNKLSNSGSKC